MSFSYRPFSIPLALSIGVLFTGCVEKVEPTAAGGSEANVQVVQTPETETPAETPQANNGRIVPETPAAGTMTTNPASAPPVPTTTGQPIPPQSQNQDALAKQVSAAEAQYASNPNDSKARQTLANALYNQGQAIMYDEKIPPRMKYGPALKLFNRALTLDPTHQKAAENKEIIVKIYQSMGRPIPE